MEAAERRRSEETRRQSYAHGVTSIVRQPGLVDHGPPGTNTAAYGHMPTGAPPWRLGSLRNTVDAIISGSEDTCTDTASCAQPLQTSPKPQTPNAKPGAPQVILRGC